jgi:magnesium chelatase subunit D
MTNDIAFDATIRAAAPYQSVRKNEKGHAVVIKDSDIREKVLDTPTWTVLLFIVYASGSMGA